MRAAADSYDQVVADMVALRDLCAEEEPDLKRAAEVLASGLDGERAALASLQQALEGQ